MRQPRRYSNNLVGSGLPGSTRAGAGRAEGSDTRSRQHLGKASERLAATFLTLNGYRVEQMNARFPVGEIDIVAWEGQTLCFVEVRATSSSDWGGPLATIDGRKRRHLIRAAQWYLARLRMLPPETRFDVVAVTWETAGKPSLELIRGAFDAS